MSRLEGCVIDDALNLDDKALGYDLLDRLTSASGGYGTGAYPEFCVRGIT
ncbi:MAG: hypothetical protein HYV17_00565 [Xanthomonadales bacterium]|nr:hypothetical protein [Xanthomonadales bacterium]